MIKMDESGKIYKQNVQAYYKASFFTNIKLLDADGRQLRLSTGERLIFGVKKSYDDVSYLLKKVLNKDNEINGEYTVSFTPEQMSIIPGRYFYDVSVQYPSGVFIKIIPKSGFIINDTYTVKEVS